MTRREQWIEKARLYYKHCGNSVYFGKMVGHLLREIDELKKALKAEP